MNEKLKPLAEEYGSFYHGYITKVIDQDISKLLTDQINEIVSLYQDLGEEKSLNAYAPGKWSAKEVLGHMLDTDKIMAYRALCFSRGDSQSLPGFDQDKYVEEAGFNDIPLADLLEDFSAFRKSIVSQFRNTRPDTYPNIGEANQNKVTVRALYYIIAGHTKHHLDILKERYI